MSSEPHTIALSSDSEAENTTSAFAPTGMPMSPTKRCMQSQQPLPAFDSEASPQESSESAHQNKQVQLHPPYEPAAAGKVFPNFEEKEIHKNTTQEQGNVLPTPTVFLNQTTTVPLTFTLPTPATPPATTHSTPVSPRQRTFQVRPSSSDPGVRTENRRRRRTYKRVNTRNWSFLLPILRYWRSQEGKLSARELGETSSTTSRIIPVTGEPVSHTVPLLAARLVRHEDRLDAIATILNGLPCEHITSDVSNLMTGQVAIENRVELVEDHYEEIMGFIGALCAANTATGDYLGTMDHELEKISAQNFTIRRAIRESYAREMARDQTIETMLTKIQELQRRLDDATGKP